MELKPYHIFIYILPGLFLLLNILIYLIGIEKVHFNDLLININLASSFLILLVSMLTGYVLQVIYTSVMGKYVVGIRIDTLGFIYHNDSTETINLLNQSLEELENIGMFFVSVVVSFMIVFLTILADSIQCIQTMKIKGKIIYSQSFFLFLLMIAVFFQIKTKTNEVWKLILDLRQYFGHK